MRRGRKGANRLAVIERGIYQMVKEIAEEALDTQCDLCHAYSGVHCPSGELFGMHAVRVRLAVQDVVTRAFK